jgi:hypothetical protein
MEDNNETPIDFTILFEAEYATNTEYREIIRKIFRMKMQYTIVGNDILFNDGTMICREDIDDETLDELNIDDTRFDICFKYIWEITKDMPKIVELYEFSSSKFMATDMELGIANLLSFYGLHSFYSVLCKIHKGELVDEVDIDNIRKHFGRGFIGNYYDDDDDDDGSDSSID